MLMLSEKGANDSKEWLFGLIFSMKFGFDLITADILNFQTMYPNG